MTDNKRALHTVLAHCIKPLHPTEGSAAEIEQLKTRLLEIQSTVEKRLIEDLT